MKIKNIIDAIKDANILRPYLAPHGSLATWKNWRVFLHVLYGLPVDERHYDLIHRCTGRDPTRLPPDGFRSALALVGRRSGKSRIAAVIGAYEASMSGRWERLAAGEKGLVAICSPTVSQSRKVRDYLDGIYQIPLLAKEVIESTKDYGLEVKNNVRIEMLPGDFKKVRGHTLLAAIVDEAAFFGVDGDVAQRTDTELMRALEPGLMTTEGKLIAISSPYARRGWCYKTYLRNFGNDAGNVLVWNAPSKVMNDTLPQADIDKAIAEDMQAGKSEYLAEFRDDIGEFINRAVLEKLVVHGRHLLPPEPDTRYTAFVDLGGGRVDDAALAVAHRTGRVVVLDYIKRWRPPFNPYTVIGEMAADTRHYRCRRVTGDNFGAEFVAQAFQNQGVPYHKCDKPKSILYAELLPRLCSGEIELLDDEVLVSQLAGLERRTRAGGKDIIDHALGAHDDVANAAAGCAVVAACNVRIVGAIRTREPMEV